MTINEILGKNYPMDGTTFRQFYGAIIEKLGEEAVRECIPFDRDILAEQYEKDEHLNFQMRLWDMASGFSVHRDRHSGTEIVSPIPSQLRSLLARSGVNCYSNAEGVCILKECARRMLAE